MQMLTQPTPDQLQALYRLTRSPDWPRVNQMLDAELAEVVRRVMLFHEPWQLHQAQGRGQNLRELQEIVRDAEALVEKLGKSTL